jgi:D-alanyl-D-alanine carboxypeptidase
MASRRSARSPRSGARRERSPALAALVLAVAALAGIVGHDWLAPSSSSASPPGGLRPGETAAAVTGARTGAAVLPPPRTQDPGQREERPSGSRFGEQDGDVPDGVTVFDDDLPAVTRLEPSLLGALRRAATDAAHDGVSMVVNSGWRSPAYQQHLLDEAIDEHGSAEAAARWVATPETSQHVAGAAVDIGPRAAATWLARHGAAYGLCQTYRNETWHFELRPAAVDHGCPRPYADPTQDPRMQG